MDSVGEGMGRSELMGKINVSGWELWKGKNEVEKEGRRSERRRGKGNV